MSPFPRPHFHFHTTTIQKDERAERGNLPAKWCFSSKPPHPNASRSVADFSLYLFILSRYQWLSCRRESEDHLYSLFLAWRLFSDNFVTLSGQLKCCLCHRHIQCMALPACSNRLGVRAVYSRPAVPYVAVTNVCCGSADTWNVRIDLLCQKFY